MLNFANRESLNQSFSDPPEARAEETRAWAQAVIALLILQVRGEAAAPERDPEEGQLAKVQRV